MTKYLVKYMPVENNPEFGGGIWRTGSPPITKYDADVYAEALKKKRKNLIYTKVVEYGKDNN